MARLRINEVPGLHRVRTVEARIPGLRGAYIDNAVGCRKRVGKKARPPSVAVPEVPAVNPLAPLRSGGGFPGVVAPFAAVLDLQLNGDVSDPHQ
jgi:hypothetical protein